jgi:hypothetical protein
MFRLLPTLLAVFFLGSSVFAQQPPPKHYSSKELRELNNRYNDFKKNMKEVMKHRQELETSLKAYDVKLKALALSMEKTEEQIDFASGVYSYDPNFIASTREMQAIEMAYNLKSVDLIGHISSENTQLTRVNEAMAAKYDKMEKMKSAGR